MASKRAQLGNAVGEECGWRVAPITVIGFVHSWRFDDQRPALGPAGAGIHRSPLCGNGNGIRSHAAHSRRGTLRVRADRQCRATGIEALNRTLLAEALRKRGGR